MHRLVHRASRLAPAVLVAILSVAFAGCDMVGGDSGGSDAPVTVSFVASSSSGGSASTAATPRALSTAHGTILTDGEGDTLLVHRVQVFIRQVEFDSAEDGDDPEVEPGPFLVDVPLDSSPTVQIETSLPEGKWAGFELELDKRESTDDVGAGRFPAGKSVRVTGIWRPAGADTSAAVSFTSDVDAEREVMGPDTLEVTAGETANLTVSVGVGGWFRESSGNLIPPQKAGNDGQYEDLVEENITASFEGFEDEDRDGDDDDDDDD